VSLRVFLPLLLCGYLGSSLTDIALGILVIVALADFLSDDDLSFCLCDFIFNI
jgi:hypothetical protein